MLGTGNFTKKIFVGDFGLAADYKEELKKQFN